MKTQTKFKKDDIKYQKEIEVPNYIVRFHILI